MGKSAGTGMMDKAKEGPGFYGWVNTVGMEETQGPSHPGKKKPRRWRVPNDVKPGGFLLNGSIQQ